MQDQAGRGPLAPFFGDPEKLRTSLQTRDGHDFVTGPAIRARTDDRAADSLSARLSREESGGQALAALGTTLGQDATSTDGGHARAKAVAAGANELAGLIGTLHGSNSKRAQKRSIGV